MSVFVDTSALYAILDTDDENHERAGKLWSDLVAQEAQLISSNYALLETLVIGPAQAGGPRCALPPRTRHTIVAC